MKLKKCKSLEIKLADAYYYLKLLFWIVIALILLFIFGFSLSLIPLIFLIVPGVFVVLNFGYLITYLTCKALVKKTDNKFVSEIGKDYVNSYKGPPGTGKSTINNYSSIVKANYQWEQLQIEYALLIPFEEDILESGDSDKIHFLKEVKESFEYYAKNRDVIPLLSSNIPIKDFYNRTSTVLDVDHLEMRERLPYLGVGVYDEIGLTLMADNKRGTSKNARLSSFMRFDRQFAEYTLGMTEQNSKNQNIVIRSVVAINRCMLGQKSFLKPKTLILIHHFLCKQLIRKFKNIDNQNFEYIIEKARKVNKRYIQFLRFLSKFLKAVGFRIFRYKDTENDELKTKVNSDDIDTKEESEVVIEKGRFVIPAYSNCITSDRPFKFAYIAKDKKLKFDKWQNLIIEDEKILKSFEKYYK